MRRHCDRNDDHTNQQTTLYAAWVWANGNVCVCVLMNLSHYKFEIRQLFCVIRVCHFTKSNTYGFEYSYCYNMCCKENIMTNAIFLYIEEQVYTLNLYFVCNFIKKDLPAAVQSPRSRPETLSSSYPTGIRMSRDVWRSSPPLYDNIVERTHCFTFWWTVFQL